MFTNQYTLWFSKARLSRILHSWFIEHYKSKDEYRYFFQRGICGFFMVSHMHDNIDALSSSSEHDVAWRWFFYHSILMKPYMDLDSVPVFQGFHVANDEKSGPHGWTYQSSIIPLLYAGWWCPCHAHHLIGPRSMVCSCGVKTMMTNVYFLMGSPNLAYQTPWGMDWKSLKVDPGSLNTRKNCVRRPSSDVFRVPMNH